MPKSGTFVYSPDIRVVIDTPGGTLDVSSDIVEFDLARRTNAISTFGLQLNNSFRKYDRRIFPMDRIVVFLKRTQWVQVFAGYVSTAPIETVVPGDVSIQALCTLKRLEHTYWDPYYEASRVLMPGLTGNVDRNLEDGGAAKSMFRILTQVASWDEKQIHIQKIPQDFMKHAESLNKRVIESIDQNALDRWNALLGGAGTTAGGNLPGSIDTGEFKLPGTRGRCTYFAGPGNTDATGNMSLTLEPGLAPKDNWYCAMRWNNNTVNALSAAQKNFWLRQKILVVPDHDPSKAVVLRPADVGPGIMNVLIDVSPPVWRSFGFPPTSGQTVSVSVVDPSIPLGPYRGGGSNNGGTNYSNTPVASSTKHIKRQGNINIDALSPGAKQFVNFLHTEFEKRSQNYAVSSTVRSTNTNHGTHKRTAIDFGDVSGNNEENQRAYRAVYDFCLPYAQGPNHTISELFLAGAGQWSNGAKIYSQKIEDGHRDHTHVAVRDPAGWGSNGVAPGLGGFSSGTEGTSGQPGGQSPFNIKTPGFNEASDYFTGERAFINDEKVLLTIQQLSSACLRDFQSAPTGDFVAWFPDWFGVYGKTPMMELRDIEIVDFKMQWSDDALATHVAIAGDINGAGGVEPNEFIESRGIITVQQPELFKILLGLDPDKEYQGLSGNQFLERFGLRPKVQELPQIRDHNYEFFYSLQIFMKQWTMQYNSPVQLTFMPELYPGMRLDLVDHDLQVYVEEVIHSGSRARGFSTGVTVSAPVTRDGRILGLEYNPIIASNAPNDNKARYNR